jgi:hypothetical protein
MSSCNILASGESVSGAGRYEPRMGLLDLFLSGWSARVIRSCSFSRKDESVGSFHVFSTWSFRSRMLWHIRVVAMSICAKYHLHSAARAAFLSSGMADHLAAKACSKAFSSSSVERVNWATSTGSDSGPKRASSNPATSSCIPKAVSHF